MDEYHMTAKEAPHPIQYSMSIILSIIDELIPVTIMNDLQIALYSSEPYMYSFLSFVSTETVV